jgi:Spy/CpxP family protein refolding chaperone
MTKLVVIIGFCVAFAAGLTVGRSRQWQADTQQPGSPSVPSTRPSRASFLASELNLNAQQQEQLKQIWSEAARGGRGESEKRRQQLREKRDADIEALIPAGDKANYQQVLSAYRAELDAMDREMRERFRNSVEETKKVLTPEQRAKYEEILSRHSFGSPGGGPGREWGRDRETTRRSEPPAK